MILLFILVLAAGIGLTIGIIKGFTPTPELVANSPPDESILDEIAHLEIMIERRKESAMILEKELETASEKRKVTILSRLNTLDNQTFKDTQKLNKLLEKLD